MLATQSNESKIARTLEQLNCAAQNFCRIANVGLTRFLQGLSGQPGKHFDDDTAAYLLEVCGELYQLQLDADMIMKSHLPIDFKRVDDIVTALAIRRAAKIAAEDGDHELDSHVFNATKGLVRAQQAGA
jgi:hypothetical protein